MPYFNQPTLVLPIACEPPKTPSASATTWPESDILPHITDESSTGFPILLHKLARSFEGLFEASGGIEDLDTAIAIRRRLLQSTPNHTLERVTLLADLGHDWLLRSMVGGFGASKAIAILHEAFSKPCENQMQPSVQTEPTTSTWEYVIEDALATNDIILCIAREQSSEWSDPVTEPVLHKPAVKLNLIREYGSYGRAAYLEEALISHRKVFGEMARRGSSHAEIQKDVEELLHGVFEGAVAFLAGLRPVSPPPLALEEQQGDTRSLFNLRKLIQHLEHDFLGAPVTEQPSSPMWVAFLGVAYKERHKIEGIDVTEIYTSGIDQVINLEIRALEQALTMTAVRAEDRHLYQRLLGLSYNNMYGLTGDIDHVDKAIDHIEKSLKMDVNPNQDDHHAVSFLLGHLQLQKSSAASTIGDLEKPMAILQGVLGKLPVRSQIRPAVLSNLAGCYLRRYESVLSMADLESAIALSRQGIRDDACSQDVLSREQFAQNLGVGYLYKYQRSKDLDHLNISIQYLEGAIAEPTGRENQRFFTLGSLAGAYASRFDMMKSQQDLDRAIQAYQGILRGAEVDHSARINAFRGLADAYFKRYSYTNDPKDLEKCSRHARQALERISQDYPLRPNLINTLRRCFAEPSAVATISDSMITGWLEESLGQGNARVRDRINSGESLYQKYAYEGAWGKAYAVAVQVVALVPLLVPKFLESSDKQTSLLGLHGVASDAAAISLQAHKTPYEAVRLLELGRGSIHTSLSALRVDLSDLQVEHPQLAATYSKLQGHLDTVVLSHDGSPTSFATPYNSPDTRYNASQEFEQLLAEIRQLPNFERFLVAPSETDMREVAKALGPIVMINASEYRCDALIIEGSGVRSLRLPRLYLGAITSFARKLEATRINLEVLEWLWKSIVKPVLAILGFHQQPSQASWPRICWIPTGALTGFPLHAAGLHLEDESSVLLNRAISSYSHSIRALVEGHQSRLKSPVRTPKSAAFVGVQKNLAYVNEEIKSVKRICNSMGLQILEVELQAPRAKITDILKECDIFHFAGHGRTDRLDPLSSAVIIGGADGSLTVDHLFKANLRQQTPLLAYLSACSTGRIDHEGLADEGLHLMAGFQLAGFRNVIGTLWMVADDSCVEIATDTYKWIKDHGMSETSIAEGLHHACKGLRSQWLQHHSQHRSRAVVDADDDDEGQLHWVPYILYYA